MLAHQEGSLGHKQRAGRLLEGLAREAPEIEQKERACARARWRRYVARRRFGRAKGQTRHGAWGSSCCGTPSGQGMDLNEEEELFAILRWEPGKEEAPTMSTTTFLL